MSCYCFYSRVTKSDLRSVTPLLKRVVVGGMGLNTACWKGGKTYTMTPIPGLVVSMFLQPGSNAANGYTVFWAIENALNVAANVIVTFLYGNHQSTITMTAEAGVITPTNTWSFQDGAYNFQLAAVPNSQ
jgi:hypothetical protein